MVRPLVKLILSAFDVLQTINAFLHIMKTRKLFAQNQHVLSCYCHAENVLTYRRFTVHYDVNSTKTIGKCKLFVMTILGMMMALVLLQIHFYGIKHDFGSYIFSIFFPSRAIINFLTCLISGAFHT